MIGPLGTGKFIKLCQTAREASGRGLLEMNSGRREAIRSFPPESFPIYQSRESHLMDLNDFARANYFL